MTDASPALRRYLGGWRVAGALAVVAALLTVDVDWGRVEDAGGAVALVALLLASVLAQRMTLELDVRAGDEQLTVSLVEAAFATALLVVGGVPALLVLLVATIAVQATSKKGWMRASFNVAQYAVAATVSVWVHQLLVGGAPPLGPRGLVAITLAMIVFGMLNWLAVTGAVSLAEGRSVWTTTTEIQQLSGASTLGNTAVGIITALVWSIHPAYALLMFAPLVTLVAAYRGTARAAQLLRQVTADRDRTDRVISGASDGIALLDHRGRVELWSPALATITGVAEDEALDRTLGDVLEVRDGDAPIDLDAEVAALDVDDRHRTLEGAVTRDDDSDRVVRIAPTGLFEGRTRIGTVLLVQDVTRERETERLKDDFLMRVSHELRTPLTPIKGFASSLLMAKGKASPKVVEESLTRIVERSDHMIRLIDDLLLVARERPGDSAAPGISDPIDLADVVRDGAERWRALHPDREITTSLEATMVPVAAQDVRRILDVLLDNAIRYSPPGSIVEVVATRHGDVAELRVTDHGRGIPSDQLDRVFERFHRVEDPMRMTTGGLGVGLTIARSLAERVGGALRATSRFGAGSTFVLELPLLASLPEAQASGTAR